MHLGWARADSGPVSLAKSATGLEFAAAHVVCLKRGGAWKERHGRRGVAAGLDSLEHQLEDAGGVTRSSQAWTGDPHRRGAAPSLSGKATVPQAAPPGARESPLRHGGPRAMRRASLPGDPAASTAQGHGACRRDGPAITRLCRGGGPVGLAGAIAAQARAEPARARHGDRDSDWLTATRTG